MRANLRLSDLEPRRTASKLMNVKIPDAALSAPTPAPVPTIPLKPRRYQFNKNEGIAEGRKPVQLRVLRGGRTTPPKS